MYKIPIEEFEESMDTELSEEKKKDIHDLFTKSNKLRSESEFVQIRVNLHTACRKGDLELIKIYLSETIENNSKDLRFKINENNQTASLVRVCINSNQLVVPRTVKHKSTDYLITSIIYTNNYITSIKFEEDSEVQIIYMNALSDSKIETIYFPPSLKVLKDGWCFGANKLTKIIIPPSNSHFIFKDDKYLLGKSDENKDEFDVLLFASRDIKEISIPSNIKIISPFAFNFCRNLTKVEIPIDSNLQIIGSNAFSYSKIEEIFIPSKVLKICENSFSNCYNLKKVEIPTNSNLQTIEKSAFFGSKFIEIYFPSNLRELKGGWCFDTEKLRKIAISPLNSHFIFKDDKYLLGKSDENKDEFDVLLFASRDIKEISIPSNIKIISPYAFYICKNLTKVEISIDSNLQTIGTGAFSLSNIDEIFIPSKVSKICRNAFDCCRNLKKIDIPTNSNLQTIEKYAFYGSNIKDFFIPEKVTKICENTFKTCKNLQIIEISEQSELKSFHLSAFSEYPKLIIMIPSSLNNFISLATKTFM